MMASNYIYYYKEYQERVERFRGTDPRELVYQNRVLIPFLEELFREDNQRLEENERIDVVDVSTQYRKSAGQDCSKYRWKGAAPPDLLIARNWKLRNAGRTDIDYLATIEVKSPDLKQSIHDKSSAEVCAYLNAGGIGRQLKFHLKACPTVILTDCLRWQFFAPPPPKTELKPKAGLKPWLDIPLWDNDRKKWRTEEDWKKLSKELRKIAELPDD